MLESPEGSSRPKRLIPQMTDVFLFILVHLRENIYLVFNFELDHKCGDFHLILSYLVFVLFLDLCLPYHMREREEVHKKFESR